MFMTNCLQLRSTIQRALSTLEEKSTIRNKQQHNSATRN